MKSTKLFLAAALIALVAPMQAFAESVRQNALQLGVCALACAGVATGLIDPGTATVVGFLGVTGLAPFPVQEDLTAVALMYRNKTVIADDIMPRVSVGAQAFKYFKHTLADGFTIPDTKVGRTSAPNRVEFTATEVADNTVDYGLDDPIPYADIENARNASPTMDPEAKSAEYTSNLIQLDREVRVATATFTAGNYAGGNQSTLSGTSQWSDFTNSDPISAIMAALDSMVMRGNIAVMGQAVWTKLSTHPRIVKAFNGSSGDTGKVTRDFVRELFELEGLYVGQSWYNTARKGQTATLARAWGKHCALLYRDSLADASRGTTWGFTAQWGQRVSGSIEDKSIGLRGGKLVRVGESVKEVISANDLGFLFVNAVA